MGAWRVTASRWSSGCRSRPLQTRRTSPTCAPRRSAWVIFSRASTSSPDRVQRGIGRGVPYPMAMSVTYTGKLNGRGLRVALICARFNDLITERLLTGALDALERHDVDDDSVTIAWVPGAFELPVVAKRLAASGDYDAIVCLGAVIRGATGHYDQVANQCAAGLS